MQSGAEGTGTAVCCRQHTFARLAVNTTTSYSEPTLRMNSSKPGRRITFMSWIAFSISTGIVKKDTPASSRTAWNELWTSVSSRSSTRHFLVGSSEGGNSTSVRRREDSPARIGDGCQSACRAARCELRPCLANDELRTTLPAFFLRKQEHSFDAVLWAAGVVIFKPADALAARERDSARVWAGANARPLQMACGKQTHVARERYSQAEALFGR